VACMVPEIPHDDWLWWLENCLTPPW
jgi:hypothetical protein